MNRKILSADLDPVTRYELLIRLEGLPTHDKLCHGDFCPSNVLLTPDGKPYIIDWAHATQGNASADAARTFLKFSLTYGEERANKYLDLFCKKSDTAKQYVQRWMPIVAASQSVKGHEAERDLLLKWVNVVEYE
jgi:thiamine kinase-like enzyme